ncbi:hypothetical protein [Streptacidiphilus rugosus]|uniref:hypothetical protein n=1 Tax=Streptacidiphilus rugosus TaxID=405783 RepID=UPI0007C814D8|nr:hypothetical protein [Streptacidiphilus rugosus]
MRFGVGRANLPGRRAITSPVPAGGQAPPARRTRHHRERTGTEPTTALSDLPARRLLAAIFGPVYLAGAALFAFMAANAKPDDVTGRNTFIGFAALCALLALIAGVDLLVIHARMAEERRAGLAWRHDRPWVVRGEVVPPPPTTAPAPAGAAVSTDGSDAPSRGARNCAAPPRGRVTSSTGRCTVQGRGELRDKHPVRMVLQ